MGSLVLITGAAGDLGRAIGGGLSAAGWEVVRSDHPARADDVDRAFDVCDPVAVEAAVTDVAARGQLRAVVCAAGVQGDFGPIDAHDPQTARHVVEVNVMGTINVLAAAARSMPGGGSVVALASMAGVSGAPNMAAYSASKAAVIGLVKSAAKDLAPRGIRVNAVSPGFIGPGAMWDRQVAAQAEADTQYYATDPAVVAEQMRALVPLRRVGTPSEVAAAVGFLVSDAASFVTGINLEVAGGSV